MKKRKSVIKLAVVIFVLLFGGVISVLPTFPVGNYDYKSPISKIKLGLDLQGGVYVTFDVNTHDKDNVLIKDFDTKITSTAKIMQSRLSAKGYSEAVVTVVNTSNLRVEIPDIESPSDVFDILAKPALLQIRILSADGKIVTDAKNIVKAVAGVDESGKPAVHLEMNKQGQKDLASATSGLNYGKDKIFFILDGVTVSEATVNGAITGKNSMINGLESAAAAESLAVQITSGAYELTFADAPIEMRTISPRLGEDAIKTTLIAGGISLVLIMFFLILFYGVMGVAACLALTGYTVLMILALALIPFAQLTLPGIAGIIIGIGMAVDANIIIFERIKDEFKSGKSLQTSFEDGFRKAFSAIFDSNLTTLIGAVVLLFLATGAVKGFAVTLLFSVVISFFSSIVLSKFFVKNFMVLSSDKPSVYGLKEVK